MITVLGGFVFRNTEKHPKKYINLFETFLPPWRFRESTLHKTLLQWSTH